LRKSAGAFLTSVRWFFIIIFLLPGLSACEGDGSSGAIVETSRATEITQNWLLTPLASPLQPADLASPGLSSTPALGLDSITATATDPATNTSSPQPAKSSITTNTLTQKPPPTVTPDFSECLEAGGHFETGSLKTKMLRVPLSYRIYLPPCYGEQPGKRYPVLYLFHGQSFKDDQWDRIGADETADRLITSGEIPPLIIVMPYDQLGGQPVETSFARAVVGLLVPHIDQTYFTMPDRFHRAVGGLSRGGGWALHFGIAYWDVFGLAGGHSAAVFHSDAQQMRAFLDAIPPDSYPRIYLDIGDRDRPEIMRAILWFEALLNEKDIPHEWHLFTGYHNEAYWAAHMEQYLRWYTRDW
jgi:enterochelin esterase-like enzyme